MKEKTSSAVEPKPNRAFESAQRKLVKIVRSESGGNRATVEKLWEQGFLPDKLQLYDFETNGVSSYLSDVQREMTKGLNGEHAAILNNKLLFEAFFSQCVRTTETVFYTDRGAGVHIQQQEALKRADASYYAKPIFGGGGRGVFRCDVQAGRVLVKGTEHSWDAFEALLLSQAGDYMLTKAIRQHPALARIYAGSTNTIRILMMRDTRTAKGFIASAVLRVGTAETGGVDNFSRGGLSFELDVRTGEVGRGARKHSVKPREIEVHPDTGVRVTGVTIPFWEQAVTAVQEAFDLYRPLRYVGWDLVISEAGPMILEGNNYSDVHLLQVHRPLLADPRVREFYEASQVDRWRETTLPLFERPTAASLRIRLKRMLGRMRPQGSL